MSCRFVGGSKDTTLQDFAGGGASAYVGAGSIGEISVSLCLLLLFSMSLKLL